MDLAAFLAKWSKKGGSERANKGSFLAAFSDLLGLPHPDATRNDVQDVRAFSAPRQ
jgi:hypothetical protein